MNESILYFALVVEYVILLLYFSLHTLKLVLDRGPLTPAACAWTAAGAQRVHRLLPGTDIHH